MRDYIFAKESAGWESIQKQPVSSTKQQGLPTTRCLLQKSASYEELLRWADLHTLRNCRLQEMATVMYKVKNNLSPSCIADIFKLNNSGYHLRNSDFIIPRFNSVT